MTLAEYLDAADLSYTDFARDLGVTDSTVLRWAKGERSPSAYWAAKMEGASKGAIPVASWPQRVRRVARRVVRGPRRRSPQHASKSSQ